MNIEDKVTLYEEYRLIEKSESEINAAWKGAHLLLFFLSFVFGSFCTFCFHLLMYIFDDKCILYPKLISLRDLRQSGSSGIIFDYIAKKELENLPVDFVTTQWMDRSTCYLPQYVPLLSGICGLVWTTMFLMCSSGSRSLTGLQRPWRILPPVFLFSTAMAGLCIYTSYVTQSGLEQLCAKLGEFTGSNTCSYTINVATLAYERRIRGVHQATRLTMASAWLHTFCWVGAAVLALARVILVVDFRLVRVRADLVGNFEQMLERQETHIRTDDIWNKIDKSFGTNYDDFDDDDSIEYISPKPQFGSKLSIIPADQRKMVLQSKFSRESHKFIGAIIKKAAKTAGASVPSVPSRSSETSQGEHETETNLRRTVGQRILASSSATTDNTGESPVEPVPLMTPEEAEHHARLFRQKLRRTHHIPRQPPRIHSAEHLREYKSEMNLTPEMIKRFQESRTERKGSLREPEKQKEFERKQKVVLQTPHHSALSVQTKVEGDTGSMQWLSDENEQHLRVLFEPEKKQVSPQKGKKMPPQTKDSDKKPKKDTEVQTESNVNRFFLTLGSLFVKRNAAKKTTNETTQTSEPVASTSTAPDDNPLSVEKETQTKEKEKQD